MIFPTTPTLLIAMLKFAVFMCNDTSCAMISSTQEYNFLGYFMGNIPACVTSTRRNNLPGNTLSNRVSPNVLAVLRKNCRCALKTAEAASSTADVGSTGRSIPYVGKSCTMEKKASDEASHRMVPNTVYRPSSSRQSRRVVIPNVGVTSNAACVSNPLAVWDIRGWGGVDWLLLLRSSHSGAGNKRP